MQRIAREILIISRIYNILYVTQIINMGVSLNHTLGRPVTAQTHRKHTVLAARGLLSVPPPRSGTLTAHFAPRNPRLKFHRTASGKRRRPIDLLTKESVDSHASGPTESLVPSGFGPFCRHATHLTPKVANLLCRVASVGRRRATPPHAHGERSPLYAARSRC